MMRISKFESFSELLFTAKVLVPFAFESNHPVQRWRRIIPGRSADRGSPSLAAKPAIHVHAFCLCIFESDDKQGMPCFDALYMDPLPHQGYRAPRGAHIGTN
jgi:hypothetical protein